MTKQIPTGIQKLSRRGVTLCALLLFACAPAVRTPEVTVVRPQLLPLEFEGDLQNAEFSGICWWGDDLLILPQFPESQGNSIFAISRDSLARAIAELESGGTVTPLRPRRIPTETAHVPTGVRDYDGLEAMAIRGDRCYVLAEFGEGGESWGSMLVTGSLAKDEGVVRFEQIADAPVLGPQVRDNFTHEAIVLTGDEVWVICELNGRSVTDRPVVARFTTDLEPLGEFSMPSLEYRVTDATNLDAEGRFWVLNLFWPPDAPIVSPGDPSGPLERLIPLRRVGDAIELDPGRPVLDLRGDADRAMFNWEGVARWGEEGFLLVTDSYPDDLLAYVGLPE